MSSSSAQPTRSHGIGLLGLIALVISSAIGSGVFALSSDIAHAAAPGPAIIAWLLSGVGFMALASTFGRLSVERPELDGIVAYAQDGFGSFMGFVSGWGYWLSIWIGNVAFGVMLITALGFFFPVFTGPLGLAGVAVISVVNWAMVGLVSRGVEQASFLNAIVMVCKLLPIVVFIITMISLFDVRLFTADFWGTLANNVKQTPDSVGAQIAQCLLVMMWVFVGMEGATVLGRRARHKHDVSRATILGTAALVAIYIAASILPYGFLTRAQIASVQAPSMASIFSMAVGSWGGAFISAGLVISILGAWLSYTILASEALSEMASMRLLPQVFNQFNSQGTPLTCLLLTGLMIQLLSILMLFSAHAYNLAYSLCTASIVVSWVLAAGAYIRYACKQASRSIKAVGVASIAILYLVIATILSGPEKLLLCCIAYVPGIFLYVRARKELRLPQLTKGEAAAAFVIVLAALGGVWHLVVFGL